MKPAPKVKQKQLGKSKDQLRMRGKKIAAGLLKGMSQEDALISAGYSTSTAKSQAASILLNPVIKGTYCEILEKAGLTDEFAAGVHKDLMIATDEITTPDGQKVLGTKPDHTIRARGLDMFYKVRGRYVEKKEISGKDGGPIEFANLTDEELQLIASGSRRGRSEGIAKAKKVKSKPARLR